MALVRFVIGYTLLWIGLTCCLEGSVRAISLRSDQLLPFRGSDSLSASDEQESRSVEQSQAAGQNSAEIQRLVSMLLRAIRGEESRDDFTMDDLEQEQSRDLMKKSNGEDRKEHNKRVGDRRCLYHTVICWWSVISCIEGNHVSIMSRVKHSTTTVSWQSLHSGLLHVFMSPFSRTWTWYQNWKKIIKEQKNK